MREIMRKNCNVLLLISLILICSKLSFGQLVSDEYCKKVENIIATPFNPAHWYHNIAFSDECSFEFDIDKKGGVGISFSLEKSKSKKLAHKSLHSDIEMYEFQHTIDRGKKLKFPKYTQGNFWDEAYFSESYGPMLLRKRNAFITVFCDDKKLCPQIEEKLRLSSIFNEEK